MKEQSWSNGSACCLCIICTVELLLLQKLQVGNISATTRIKHIVFHGCPEYPYVKSGFGVLRERILRSSLEEGEFLRV